MQQGGASYDPLSQARGSSAADTTTVSTLAAPAGAMACLITVETTDARMTFDGSAPSATNGQVMKQGVALVFVPLADQVNGIKWTSTAAAVSTVNVTWLG